MLKKVFFPLTCAFLHFFLGNHSMRPAISMHGNPGLPTYRGDACILHQYMKGRVVNIDIVDELSKC